MDKEEIIRRLKKISEHAVHVTGEPPFIMSLDDGLALDEAVQLLKEQEAAEPMKESDDYPGSWWYICGNCGEVIDWHDMYCRHCGREVKWE